MTKRIQGLVLGVVATGVIVFGMAQIDKLSYYEQSGVIVAIEKGVATVELSNGYIYDFDGKGFEKYDNVKVKMKNIGDDMNCYNDELVEVENLGY